MKDSENMKKENEISPKKGSRKVIKISREHWLFKHAPAEFILVPLNSNLAQLL